MQNTDNKRLVKIIIDYTKTELPEQKVEELVERLRNGHTMQDLMFLSSLGIPTYGLLTRVLKWDFRGFGNSMSTKKVSFDDFKEYILSLQSETNEIHNKHLKCQDHANNIPC